VGAARPPDVSIPTYFVPPSSSFVAGRFAAAPDPPTLCSLLNSNEQEAVMWRKIRDWHRAWEDEVLAVLEQPALAASVPPGYRRRAAEQVAALSPIERKQLLAFSTAYRGWRGWLATGKLAAAFTGAGALFNLLFLHGGWLAPVVVANAVGFSVVIGIVGVWFNYRTIVEKKWKVLGKVVLATVVCGIVTAYGVLVMTGTRIGSVWDIVPGFLAVLLGLGLLLAVPMIAIGVVRNRQYELLTAQLQADAERERLARELSESQLRMLRAQIEPHFLFNTLGAVQQLAEHGAPRAAALTADLIAFLRASLGDMRCDQVSLEAEFGLVESYLKVMQVRLGERLRFSVDLPRALVQVRVPSMILLTLAENAIKHGIEPALRGGDIALSARLDGTVLRLRVADSGVGMSVTPGAGVGLDNVRHRLRLAYGAAAGLVLRDGDPGLVAEIAMPCVPPAEAA
jgi:signal transduction histidine kinase